MRGATILVVDDDAELQRLLQRLLAQEGWVGLSALTGREGEALLVGHQPEVVVLDRMLGDADGLDLCRRWRQQRPDLCILMLSGRGDPLDKMLGLEVGADDYLGKPFERRELVARLRALMRRLEAARRPPSSRSGRLEFEGLTIDLVRGEVSASGRGVPLTGSEFKMLRALVLAPGRVLSRDALIDALQIGEHRPMDRTVDVQVGRVRRKLQAAAPAGKWITTMRGIGYLFVAAPEATPSR